MLARRGHVVTCTDPEPGAVTAARATAAANGVELYALLELDLASPLLEVVLESPYAVLAPPPHGVRSEEGLDPTVQI